MRIIYSPSASIDRIYLSRCESVWGNFSIYQRKVCRCCSLTPLKKWNEENPRSHQTLWNLWHQLLVSEDTPISIRTSKTRYNHLRYSSRREYLCIDHSLGTYHQAYWGYYCFNFLNYHSLSPLLYYSTHDTVRRSLMTNTLQKPPCMTLRKRIFPL